MRATSVWPGPTCVAAGWVCRRMLAPPADRNGATAQPALASSADHTPGREQVVVGEGLGLVEVDQPGPLPLVHHDAFPPQVAVSDLRLTQPRHLMPDRLQQVVADLLRSVPVKGAPGDPALHEQAGVMVAGARVDHRRDTHARAGRQQRQIGLALDLLSR